MPAPPKYPTNPNVIKIALDFNTLDALKALAKHRGESSDRTAYSILQHVLGVYRDQHGPQPGAASGTTSPSFNLDSFAAFKPNS